MELVEFLEDKHVYTEQYSDNVNTLAQHFENSAKFLDNLRLFSIPFILFGAAFLLVVIFQAYPLFPLFTGLGYGLISVYSVMAVCLYLKFCKQKAEIIEEFNTPYYRRPVKIDETGMMLINEELSPKMMRQFIYENFGKKANFEVIKELEEDAFHTQEKTRTTDFNDMLFEDEEDEFDDTVRFRSKTIKDNIASKYSSFLED